MEQNNTKYDSSTLSNWIKIVELYLPDIFVSKRRGGVPTVILMKVLGEELHKKEKGGLGGEGKGRKRSGGDDLEDYYDDHNNQYDDNYNFNNFQDMLTTFGSYGYLIRLFEAEKFRVLKSNLKLYNTYLEKLVGSDRKEVWEYGRGVVERELSEEKGIMDVFALDLYINFCVKIRDYEAVDKVLEMKKKHRIDLDNNLMNGIIRMGSRVNNEKKSQKIVKNIVTEGVYNGLNFNTTTYNLLIQHYAVHKEEDECWRWFEIMEERKRDNIDFKTFSALSEACLRSKNREKTKVLFEKMDEYQVQQDSILSQKIQKLAKMMINDST